MTHCNDCLISVRDLTKKFGDFTAVDHISFDVGPGEIFGFLGANGAGKTTAMRMLCGLSYPTSGTGQVAGYDINRQGERIKAHIGYMSQKFSLYEDLTVFENMRLYGGIYGLRRKEVEERADAILRRLILEERNTLVGPFLGWKQKLAFSVATCIVEDHLSGRATGVSIPSREGSFGNDRGGCGRGTTCS